MNRQATQSQQAIVTNPAGWPQEVLPLFARAITCEFATLTRQGHPITFPQTPYIGEDERTIDVSTGLAYPAKAERARRNPKVGMLFSDAVGSGLSHPPAVLIYGLATIRDTDLQANTDRYVQLTFAKLPEGHKMLPEFVLQRMDWNFTRVWIEVTPLHILWWPEGRLDEPAQRWDAPVGTKARPSDPAPPGKQPGAWQKTPTEWSTTAAHAVKDLGLPVLTVVDADGFPTPFRVKSVSLDAKGFRLDLPFGRPVEAKGPACLTFHTHPEVFVEMENKVFLGEVTCADGVAIFRVERRLADWSVSGSKLQIMWSLLSGGRKLSSRLRVEAARRGQPVPKVHRPTN